MSSKPAVQQMIDEIVDVLDKYRSTMSVSYAEVIGGLEIISRDVYRELSEVDDEDEWNKGE